MATWKKVIVSGSNAVLNQVNVNTNQQITASPSTTYLSGSFSGSFAGDGSQLTGVVATSAYNLTGSTGITSFTYNGSSPAQVAVSGASTLTATNITKWTGTAFANAGLVDNGTTVSTSGSYILQSSNANLTGSFTGSFVGDGSGLTGIVTTLSVTGSTGSGSVDLKTQGLTINGTANETSVSVSGQTVTIGLAPNVTVSGSLTVNGNTIKSNGGSTVFTLNGGSATVASNLTVNGDLTVAGTASFQNQSSLLIADRFALLASGSNTLTDGGIIVNSGGTTGSAWYLESTSTGTYGRWAVAYNADAGASTLTADEYGVTAKQASGAPSTAPTWGGSSTGFGNIYVDSGTGDIYIYA